MFKPPLSLLRETVHPSICNATARLIKRSSTPAAVYRLFLERDGITKGHVPDTLIAKHIMPDWSDDAFGHGREMRFYAELAPQLNFPQPTTYYAGREPGTANNLILLEDVRETHLFPEPTHCWTMREIRPILKAYARFHLESAPVVPSANKHEWLLPRHEWRLYETAAHLPAMVDELVDRDIWPLLPGFTNLLESVLEASAQYEQEPASLIHNDVFPPNAALPISDDSEVLLFDWEMLSWGLPEMDLAFMFLQPFRSHRNLDRHEALAYYWQVRTQQENRDKLLEPPPRVRKARQRYADSLWALWLIPVAFRMVQNPSPEHSFPRIYWDAMLTVLAAHLKELSEEKEEIVYSGL